MKKIKSAFSLIELSVVILIIGVLIIGISKGSRIVAEVKIKNAQRLTISSPVNGMSGLVFWLDASDPKTIATGTAGSGVYSNSPNNGDFVTDWKDRNPQIVTPIALSAIADTNRPKYTKNGINNIPTIQFDGTDDYLRVLNNVISAGKNDYTLAVVFQASSYGSSPVIFGMHSSSTSCNGGSFGIYITNTAGPVAWGCGATDVVLPITLKVNQPYLQILRVNRLSANTTTFYSNNYSAVINQVFSIPLDSGVYTAVGAAPHNGAEPLNGQISEVIVFDRALTDLEISDMRIYLSKKYSIKI